MCYKTIYLKPRPCKNNAILLNIFQTSKGNWFSSVIYQISQYLHLFPSYRREWNALSVKTHLKNNDQSVMFHYNGMLHRDDSFTKCVINGYVIIINNCLFFSLLIKILWIRITNEWPFMLFISTNGIIHCKIERSIAYLLD